MHTFFRRKKSGSLRKIYKPSDEEKRILNNFLPGIAARARDADVNKVAHGFTLGRSPVTNAAPHIGKAFTLCFDLQDFFDSVVPGMMPSLINPSLEVLFPDGAARQGLPTSPALANLAAAPMDTALLQLRESLDEDFVYTRYADDLTFSFDDRSSVPVLLLLVPTVTAFFGFQVNPRKTRLQASKAGRRHITGVAVSDIAYHPTRRMKRLLRAARHHRNTAQARGLAEWIKLRPPKELLRQAKIKLGL